MRRRHSPVVGITADSTDGKKSQVNHEPRLFLPQRYLDAVTESGAIPIVLPTVTRPAAIRDLLSLIDGLVISGGNFDIHPSYYGEKVIKQLGIVRACRTEFELEITQAALQRDLPILGLCGGEQVLNVVLGGSLFQDIAAQLPGAANHEQGEKKSYGGHDVEIAAGSRLYEIVRCRRLVVNTSHHQAVKKLGKGLIVNAVAEDGIIEGIESTCHSFVLGVQWHPEVLASKHPTHRRIFSAFVAACR